jgi:hypothetical protein
MLGGAGKHLRELRKQRVEQRPKRQTAPPPGGALSAHGPRLRPQGPATRRTQGGEAIPKADDPALTMDLSKQRRRRRVAIAAGAIVVVGATAAFALRTVDDPVPAAAAVAKVAAAPAAKGIAQEPTAPAKLTTKEAKGDGGIVANVPLFGPTPMATLEPAPLEATPDPEDEEQAEKAAAAASVEDATWSSEADPKSVKPWGRGRMHLPTIHKLRLNAPGGGLKGSVSATGFTVVVPDRKVLDSGRASQRRDQRIVRVTTANQGAGAQISFQFRDGVPPYRVRLRDDSVEFLISAPNK